MKKLIYNSGIACANLMLFGSLFKIQHWPGASILLVLGTILFCLVFLPMALMSSFQNEGQQKYKGLYVVTFVVFFIGMAGVLFKVMHWPGASLLLLLGIPLPFVLFLPVYLYHTRNDKKTTNTNFLGIMFGLVFLAVFSVLLALNVSKNVLNNAAANTANNDSYTSYNQSKLNDIPATNTIKRNADELCSYIDDLKCELLSSSENSACEGNQLKSDYHPMQIANKDNIEIVKKVLFNKEHKKVDELKSQIQRFHSLILASENLNPELKKLSNTLFDLSDKERNNNDDGQTISWEQREFPSQELIIVLDALSQIQSNVRLVEAEVLM